MDQQRRREIDRFADRVREYLKLQGPPYDVEVAVKQLGGKVVDLVGIDAFLSEEASVKKVDHSFEISVGPVAETRRRFNIAHEIGHLFLHMGFLVDEERWKKCSEYSEMNRQGTTEEEYEAHEFAGALLMPEKEFRDTAELFRTNRSYDTQRIANAFKVSVQAATTRGRWLGLFSWD